MSIVIPPLDTTGRDNLRQLVNLRWLAVFGQCATILVVHFVMGVPLPLVPMLSVVGGLVLLNLVSLSQLPRRVTISNGELFVSLLLDVGALTALLYQSGGANNPFIGLYLVQVVLGAILLDAWSSWTLVAVTSAAFAMLAELHMPLALPPRVASSWSDWYVLGTLICFALIAVLIVGFVSRINSNLRLREARLATMRQQAAEEDHIVRMGLLATGAAHELGTPLASLSVIVNDWGHSPKLLRQPGLAEEIEDMRVALTRCKAIVTGILMAAGEARGEHPTITSVHRFCDEVVAEWRVQNSAEAIVYRNRFGDDLAIVADTAVKQMIWNLLDNAREASGRPITLDVGRDGPSLLLAVSDTGPGFTDEMLANLGKPYHSTRARLGSGLGLFLVVNAMRKLGGTVDARNRAEGGAVVTLTLPLSALEWNAA
jgi:two-component system sensor histidine kinase RegB